MSEEHGTIVQPGDPPIMLRVKQGDTVVVFEHETVEDKQVISRR